MRYEMKDLRTGRPISATKEQRSLLLKIGRAEDVSYREDSNAVELADAVINPSIKPAKKKATKRSYKRRDMVSEAD